MRMNIRSIPNICLCYSKAWRRRRRGEGGEVRLRPLEHTEERGRCLRRVPY